MSNAFDYLINQVYTYIKEASGDLIRFPSKHNFNRANPRCLSAVHPNAETIFKILGGNEESNK